MYPLIGLLLLFVGALGTNESESNTVSTTLFMMVIIILVVIIVVLICCLCCVCCILSGIVDPLDFGFFG